MDASSRTRKRPDGTGGRCLNDYVVKGSTNNMNLLRLVLRWIVGRFAFTGDIAQFYNTCKLGARQWNLQRFIWKEDLDRAAPVKEGTITTLMYGVKCVAAQSGHALQELAETVKNEDPALYDFLKYCVYVDDMASSSSDLGACQELTRRADKLFSRVGLECKGWCFSGEDPPDKVTKDGISVGVASLVHIPAVDALRVKIPLLHFSKKRRGRLDDKTNFFQGAFGDLEEFVPKKLSRRQVTSKVASVFDVLGKFAPILIGLKLDLREVVLNTETWDEAMSPDLRNKWLSNFWKLELLKGINFQRAVMPENAINTDMRLITCVDAALETMMTGCWEVSCKRMVLGLANL